MAITNSLNNSANAFTSSTTLTVTSGNLVITAGNLVLPTGTTTVGQIIFDGTEFIFNLGTGNTWTGSSAGNLTFTTGSATGNTGVGNGVLEEITTGASNTTCGEVAGGHLTSGSNNTLIGFQAGSQGPTGISSGSSYTFIGSRTTNTSGSLTGNTCIWFGELVRETSASATNSNIAIGQGITVANLSNRIQLTGPTSCYISGITGATISSTSAVYVTSGNQLGLVASSQFLKENIEPIYHTHVLALRPVIFNYTLDTNKTKLFGLIAEEVEKDIPELVLYKAGLPESISYHQIPNLLLVKLKEQSHKLAELIDKITVIKKKLGVISCQQ